ncbi:MAG: ATP-binding protein [Pseudomonadota bacterium]
MECDAISLNGDPVMFEQAVLNLINNAMVHGGVQLTKICLTAHEVQGMLEISASDDGKGIAPKDFDRALGRFSQVGPSAGSGLGLPIAAAVAEALGGDIELRDEGDRFTVTLAIPHPSPD